MAKPPRKSPYLHIYLGPPAHQQALRPDQLSKPFLHPSHEIADVRSQRALLSSAGVLGADGDRSAASGSCPSEDEGGAAPHREVLVGGPEDDRSHEHVEAPIECSSRARNSSRHPRSPPVVTSAFAADATTG